MLNDKGLLIGFNDLKGLNVTAKRDKKIGRQKNGHQKWPESGQKLPIWEQSRRPKCYQKVTKRDVNCWWGLNAERSQQRRIAWPLRMGLTKYLLLPYIFHKMETELKIINIKSGEKVKNFASIARDCFKTV